MIKPPLKSSRPYHVNYLAGFYLNLARDVLKKFPTLKGRFSLPPGPKVRIEWILIAFLLAIVLSGARARIIPESVKLPPKAAMVKPLPETSLAPVSALEPVAVPAPTPPPAPVYTASTGGCQTYWSGDYYLDNVIRFESGGNSCATNYLGCFGLLQACPGAPLRDACGGSPACQIAWFQQYKTGGRSWAQVWQHELDFGWW